MTENYIIPDRQQPRLTPGELAVGVTHEAKGTDPTAPIPATQASELTADNASAHGGREWQRQQFLSEGTNS